MSECAVMSEVRRVPNAHYPASLRRMLEAELYVIQSSLQKVPNDSKQYLWLVEQRDASLRAFARLVFPKIEKGAG
jgi:hypothetical protein